MSVLYVVEHGATVSASDNCMKVSLKEQNGFRSVPIETLESVNIIGKSQMTTQCIETCLRRGIPVTYYSKFGSYFGKLQSTGHVSVKRQRQQAKLYQAPFALELGKSIMKAKINNQEVLLRRYLRNRNADIERELDMMRISRKTIEGSKNMEQLIGHEGMAAKSYFQALGKLVDDEFSFDRRSRRPPKDPFNSMLSLGYSILMNEIYGKIENKGLNPYFGFIHRDREKHPTLASDLMEEWRAVMVDSVVMSLVNGHEIRKDHFYQDIDEPGVFLTKDGMKIFINKLEAKERTETKYLEYVDYSVSFRCAMELQLGLLVKAIEQEDASLYKPLRIR